MKNGKGVTQGVWLSLNDASELIGISVSSLRRAVKKGEIKNKRVGGNGKVLFHRTWIESWIFGYNPDKLTDAERQELAHIAGNN